MPSLGSANAKQILFSCLLVFIGAALGIYSLQNSDRLSHVFFDTFQKLAPLKGQDEVAFVVVDQQSIDRLEQEALVPPYPRELYGAIATVAARYSARLIVYDLLFTESSRFGVEDDRRFAGMLRESGVPAYFPAASPSGLTKAPVQEIAQAAAGMGSVNSENDSDGVFRRFLKGNSMALEVLKKLRPIQEEKPPDFLRYYTRESFPSQSLYNVIKAWREMQDGVPVSVDFSSLAGRVWVVGVTASGLYDLKPTPLEAQAPGMIIPATSIANVLRGEGLATHPRSLGSLECLIFALVVLLVINFQKIPSRAIVGFLFVTLFITTGVSLLVWASDEWMSPVPLMISSLATGFPALIWKFQSDWRERLKFVGMIRHSMSPEMVDLIRRGEVSLSREGELRNVSVMFSDLVGFTEMSEKLSPEQLVEILNGYFDEVVGLVTESGGYVDKFIGDAVMAFWGAPVRQEDHAERALRAALQVQNAVQRYNKILAEKHPELGRLGVRVGLHSGVAVVGNIGAQQRYNYTAIGDTVNLASRLESLCKHYGTNLIVSEETLAEAQAHSMDGLIEIDKVTVKGKSKPTRIYTVAEHDMRFDIENFRQGLGFYYEGEWKLAQAFLYRSKFPPASIIHARCVEAMNQGVPKGWENGVWRYDSK